MHTYKYHFRAMVGNLLFLCLIGLLFQPIKNVTAAGGETFLVNSNDDTNDASIGDGHCDTDLVTALDQCSLRAAIQESNGLSGHQTINITNAILEIRLTRALPALDSVDNIGTSIYGYRTGKLSGPTVVSGVDITHPANGFVLTSDYHRLQGLIITGFKGHGVVIQGNQNIVGVDGDNLNDATEMNTINHNQDGIADNFLDDGISVAGDNNVIAGNLIGLASGGANGAPNGNNGITLVDGANANRIGSNADGVSDLLERNSIAGNQMVGIALYSTANNNIVAGNYFGLNANGVNVVGSMRSCLEVSGTGNRIGTDGDNTNDAFERNVCVGSFSYGMVVFGSTNRIAGNYIGINPNGDTAIPNSGGILLGGTGNVVGVDGSSKADASNEGNWISGNLNTGIEVYGTGVANNTIAGNFIGVRPSDLTPMPNTGNAIWAYRGSGLVIGTDGDGIADSVEGNYIISSGQNGIRLYSNQITNTIIAGNTIGQFANGVDQNGIEIDGVQGVRIGSNLDGNSDALEKNIIRQSGYAGIRVHNGASSVQIVQNEITLNTLDGVKVVNSTTNSVKISQNLIRDNSGLGINLYGTAGVDANDPLDADIGPNQLQNHPVISIANTNGANTLIMGVFSGAPNQPIQVEFFSSATCDPSGYGEGTTYLTSISLLTNASGTAAILHTLPTGLTADQFLTATATDATGNTSEFSACKVIVTGSVEPKRLYLPSILR